MDLDFFGELRDLWDEIMSKLRGKGDLPMKSATDIVNRVRERGLEEVLKLTERFDGILLHPDEVYGEPQGDGIPTFIEEAFIRLSSCANSLLERSECSVGGFHTRLDWIEGEPVIGDPVKRVGIYVPGGKYPLPSSLLMGLAPAMAAGVEEIVVATPPRNYEMIERIASHYGVKEFLKIGGIQAIASLAYGLPEVGLKPVDMIVGPGNSYVTAAKAVVSEVVRIDLLAGPSEILILYDGSVPIEFILLDMLAQAEHGPDSIALVLTTSRELAMELRDRLFEYSGDERFASLASKGGILYGDVENLVRFSEAFMPEHLEVFGDFQVRKAGAIFESLGVVYGDYGYTGANHTLPTGGTLLERPGLSPFSFFREFSGVHVYRQSGSLEAQASVSEMAAAFARLEGLEYHARSAEIRRKLYKETDR